MKILLKEEWMSNPANCELDLVEQAAKMLVNRGIATYIESPSNLDSSTTKAIEAPSVDKMVRRKTVTTK